MFALLKNKAYSVMGAVCVVRECAHSLSVPVVAVTGLLLLPNPTLVLARTVTSYTCAGVRFRSEAARESAGTSRVSTRELPTMEYSNW